MSKEFAARHLDIRDFAEDNGVLSGQGPLATYERLMAETQGRAADVPVAWTASGEVRNAGHSLPEIWLHLKAHVVLPLTCQRCLNAVDASLTAQRSFRFVPSEEMAAAQDEQAEEDVLVLSRSFDLVELVEDELLMELPLAPRHEVCPEPVKLQAADEEFDRASVQRENPFAMLNRLKVRKG
jgi:DUF177 domain-containing protein